MGRHSFSLAIAAVLASVLATAVSGADAASSGLRLVTVARGFDAPLYVTAPSGAGKTMYVVEQGGLVRVLDGSSIRSQPFLDLRARVRSGGEQGLLGLAFAPDYAKSRQFVVNYTDRNGDTRIVRYRSNGSRALPASAKTLLTVRQPYSNHNGGMVAYGPDGLLYVGMGDGGAGGDPEDVSQDRSSLLGKILRLDPDRPSARPVIVAVGVRNPWRFSFDRVNGDLWIGDVGQNAIEEVDHVAWPWRGLLNFGWDVYEGRVRFEQKPLGPGRLIQPVAQYSHARGCSITGGYVYRGSAVRAARGRYFYGDFCAGTVFSLRLVKGIARQIRVEPFRVPNLVSFGENAAGELYAVSGNGTIHRLAG